MFTKRQLFDIFGYFEENRFLKIKGEYIYDVQCPHIEPEDICFPPTHSLNTNNTYVRLNQYALDNNKLGYAGKCEVCGKVYYK